MNQKDYFKRIIEKTSCTATIKPSDGRGTVSILFAHAALGHWIEDKDFDPLLERIYYRRDCTDFDVNLLIRMIFLYGEDGVISPLMGKELKSVLLDYDYWFHDSNKRPGQQIFWTENHVLQYLTAEYLASRLYPDDIFRMRGESGRVIEVRIREKILDYINIKAKTGFCEWNSHVYADENFHALLNLYDFGGDDHLIQKAKKLLDVMFFQMAVNSYKGHYGCTHGRTYDRNVITSLRDNTGALQKLAWNLGGKIDRINALSGIAFATSGYAIPELINRIALNRDEVLETKEQQSFDVEDGPALGHGYAEEEDLVLYWHNMGYTHRLILKNNIAFEKKYHFYLNEWTFSEYRNMLRCEKEGRDTPKCHCSNYMSRVNTITYKTPDYMLSCAQDFRPGERGYQQHIWQATLDGEAIVFTNHPGPGPRPGYWAGNDLMPRALQYKSTLVAFYDMEDDYFYEFTHAYFPANAFDEVREVKGWIAARKGKGYVALCSSNGYEWSETGEEKKEIICKSKKNTWLCQLGRKANQGSFEKFLNSLPEQATLFHGDGDFTHISPKGDRIEGGYKKPLTVNGMVEKTSGYNRIKNKYAQSDYMSGIYIISDGKEKLEIDFNKVTD